MNKFSKVLIAATGAAMLFASPASARTNVVIQFVSPPAYGYTQTYYSYAPVVPAYRSVTYVSQPAYYRAPVRWDRWDRRAYHRWDNRHDRHWRH